MDITSYLFMTRFKIWHLLSFFWVVLFYILISILTLYWRAFSDIGLKISLINCLLYFCVFLFDLFVWSSLLWLHVIFLLAHVNLLMFQGSFLVKVKGPEGWSWDPEQVGHYFMISYSFEFATLFSCWFFVMSCVSHIELFYDRFPLLSIRMVAMPMKI